MENVYSITDVDEETSTDANKAELTCSTLASKKTFESKSLQDLSTSIEGNNKLGGIDVAKPRSRNAGRISDKTDKAPTATLNSRAPRSSSRERRKLQDKRWLSPEALSETEQFVGHKPPPVDADTADVNSVDVNSASTSRTDADTADADTADADTDSVDVNSADTADADTVSSVDVNSVADVDADTAANTDSGADPPQFGQMAATLTQGLQEIQEMMQQLSLEMSQSQEMMMQVRLERSQSLDKFEKIR